MIFFYKYIYTYVFKNILEIIVILLLLNILMKSNETNNELSDSSQQSYQNDLTFSKLFCHEDCTAPYMSAEDDNGSFDYCPIENDKGESVDMTHEEYMVHAKKDFYPDNVETVTCDKITRDLLKRNGMLRIN